MNLLRADLTHTLNCSLEVGTSSVISQSNFDASPKNTVSPAKNWGIAVFLY